MKRKNLLQKASTVLAELQRGSTLHLAFIGRKPTWTLSNGRRVADEVAELLVKSASVIGDQDSLFDGAPAQTFRWWSKES
jgi:hypothetical protein